MRKYDLITPEGTKDFCLKNAWCAGKSSRICMTCFGARDILN